jgi:hypothetical protein
LDCPATTRPLFFGVQIGIALLVGIAHVVGAIQRVQPGTGTAEIAFWAALVILGLLLFNPSRDGTHPVVPVRSVRRRLAPLQSLRYSG